MLVHPRKNPNEASYEIFGFQMQQSTDFNLLGNFSGMLLGQLQSLASHEAIRRGQLIYDDILREYKRKEDEKRSITQQVIRR